MNKDIAIVRIILAMVFLPLLFLGISSAFGLFASELIPPAESSLLADEGLAELLDAKRLGTGDPGLFFAANRLTRSTVEQYYSRYTRSSDLSALIIDAAIENNVALPLAFALALAESSFNINAVNQNRGSIDRGLYQLNSRSFPHLRDEDFFNPVLNARTGLAYLRECLDLAGNEVAGLAMYNAGRTRVANSGTPKMTLDYIARVLGYADQMHYGFLAAMDLVNHFPDRDSCLTLVRAGN